MDDKEKLKKFKNVDILIEFKRRFRNTCLGEGELHTLLWNIGLAEIRTWLKSFDKKIVTYRYKENE